MSCHSLHSRTGVTGETTCIAIVENEHVGVIPLRMFVVAELVKVHHGFRPLSRFFGHLRPANLILRADFRPLAKLDGQSTTEIQNGMQTVDLNNTTTVKWNDHRRQRWFSHLCSRQSEFPVRLLCPVSFESV